MNETLWRSRLNKKINSHANVQSSAECANVQHIQGVPLLVDQSLTILSFKSKDDGPDIQINVGTFELQTNKHISCNVNLRI